MRFHSAVDSHRKSGFNNNLNFNLPLNNAKVPFKLTMLTYVHYIGILRK